MAETIEKITRTRIHREKTENGMTVTERIVVASKDLGFLLAILVLGVYSATIYFLFVFEIKMDDKISVHFMVGSLTVISSTIRGLLFWRCL